MTTHNDTTTFDYWDLPANGPTIGLRGQTVEQLITRGILSPAARDMAPADILWQFNGAHAGEVWLTLTGDDAPMVEDGAYGPYSDTYVTYNLHQLANDDTIVVETGLTVADMIRYGYLAPAARDMEPKDICHQYNDTNGGEAWLVVDGEEAPVRVDGRFHASNEAACDAWWSRWAPEFVTGRWGGEPSRPCTVPFCGAITLDAPEDDGEAEDADMDDSTYVDVCEDCHVSHHYGCAAVDMGDDQHRTASGYIGNEDAESLWWVGESDRVTADEPLHKLDGYRLYDATDSETGDGITEFSSWSCEGCGTHLAGRRYRLAVETDNNSTTSDDDDHAPATVAQIREFFGWV